MPELPEVNTFKNYFDAAATGKRIVEVEVHDDKIIRNLNGHEFKDVLMSKTFIGSTRRGKYLFAHIDDGNHLLLHFGMTGDLKLYTNEEEKPRHERFHFNFGNEERLGFDCPRKFARIVYITDLDAYISDVGLGEDALEISEDDFLLKAKGKKASIKGFLLNQKVLAGVGNLYADEVLYQTKVHPASHTGAIPKRKLKTIYDIMQEVLHKAIEREAYYKDYPDDWFWQWRDVNVAPKKGKLIVEKIAGRTTYYVKGMQKKYSLT